MQQNPSTTEFALLGKPMRKPLDPGPMVPVVGKGLSREQNERVRELVRGLLREHDDNQSKLAPKLGVSQPTLSAFLGGRQGTSYGVAEQASKLADVKVGDVLSGAARLMPADRYPNRAKAAQFARGELRDDAIAFVLSMDLKRDEDLPATKWLEMMRHWHDQFEMGLAP